MLIENQFIVVKKLLTSMTDFKLTGPFLVDALECGFNVSPACTRAHEATPRLHQTAPKQSKHPRRHEGKEKKKKNHKHEAVKTKSCVGILPTEKGQRGRRCDAVLSRTTRPEFVNVARKECTDSGTQQPAIPAVLAKRKNTWDGGTSGGRYSEDLQHGCKRYVADKPGR